MIEHERAHFDDVNCPKGFGIDRPKPKPGVDLTKRECELRKKEADCMEKAIADLKKKNKNDKCIKIGEVEIKIQRDWVRENCRQK